MAHNRLAVLICMAMLVTACKSNKPKTYTSECAADIKYKPVTLQKLIDNIRVYDKQYVEVSGKYLEGKNLSALVSDSLLAPRSNSMLWVNFTQDCPLYLRGGHTGLFETEDGQYNQLNNKLMTIRGRINAHPKGHMKSYGATISDVSMVRFN